MNEYEREEREKEKAIKRLERMSVEELRDELDKRLREALIEKIQTLDEVIENTIQHAATNIICNALGVTSDHWHDGRWEVDHCNGRKSAIAEELGALALKQIQTAIPDFITGIVGQDIKMPQFRTALRKEYREQLAGRAYEKMREFAKEQAEKRSEELMAQLTNNPNALNENEDEA